MGRLSAPPVAGGDLADALRVGAGLPAELELRVRDVVLVVQVEVGARTAVGRVVGEEPLQEDQPVGPLLGDVAPAQLAARGGDREVHEVVVGDARRSRELVHAVDAALEGEVAHDRVDGVLDVHGVDLGEPVVGDPVAAALGRE
ncbi:MAG: hypothetical protein ACK55I_02760, partial [bacterium]